MANMPGRSGRWNRPFDFSMIDQHGFRSRLDALGHQRRRHHALHRYLHGVSGWKDLGQFDGRFEATVPRHGVVLVRISRLP